jgi:hypothetical protein
MRSQATSIVLAKAVNKSKSSPPMSLLLLALVLKTYGDVYRTIKRSSFWITPHTWLRGSALGRFYARRAVGLPKADGSQHCTRSLSFMISTTEPPAPVQASRTPIQRTVAVTPKSRLWKITAGRPYPSKRALMKRQRHLQKISASISLVILSLGFSFLGLLSFFNKPHADLANVPCVDSACRIAGSSAS